MKLVFSVVCCCVAMSFAASSARAQADQATSKAPTALLASIPAGYFDEPVGLPYDEEIQDQKHEDGYRWTEFKFTSLIHQGVPIRFHAIYAVPDSADAAHKAPIILMTHGIFGYSLNQPYQTAIVMYAKAGYAVVFLDWYPDWDKSFKPKTPDEPNRYTTYGKLDYFHPWTNYWLEGDDWKDSIPYQFTVGAKRLLTWVSSKPEVDITRIGATGASYGGIFSSMIAGIDTRIKAANPCVYTAGFSKTADSYNRLPPWSDQKVDDWRVRFDPEVLLSKRSIPILYTAGSKDSTFQLTKVMTTFTAMNEPRHLLIGPNRGHDYWDIAQGILFFDSALKGSFPRPVVTDLKVSRDGNQLKSSVKASGAGLKKVEFYFSPGFEIDPDRGPGSRPCELWKFDEVAGVAASDGRYEAAWTLPIMRPIDPKERITRWNDTEVLDLTSSTSAIELASDKVSTNLMDGLVRVFVRVTDAHGAMECTPLSTPIPFADPAVPPQTSIGPKELPLLVCGVLVKAKTPVAVHSDAPSGQPVVTLDLPVIQKAIGTHGYVLWNWIEQGTPDGGSGKVPPTRKRIDPPFVDSIKVDSFQAGWPWAANSSGGQLLFDDRVAGKRSSNGTAFHGMLHAGMGNAEDLSIPVEDDREHLLTLVMAGVSHADCLVRVSLIGTERVTQTVVFRNRVGSDAVFQFKFQESVKLRVQITSQSTAPYNTIVGPSAMFLD